MSMLAAGDRLCPDCMLWHSGPACGHDSTARCFDCGKPRGYRFRTDDGEAYSPAWRCCFCALGLRRPAALKLELSVTSQEAA